MQILNIAGGKARIAQWIVEHLPPHEIYIESFGGSGAVLIAKPPAKMEIFNDRDGGLVHFFEVLASRPEKLIKRIDALFYSPFRDPTPTRDPIEIAARFFLHNNTTWPAANGNSFRRQTRIDKKGRTVALVFQKRKKDLEQVAERLKSVIFENRNALEIIEHYDGPNVLHYVDPPYYGPRRGHLYEHEMMDEASHRALAAVLHRTRGSVVLSANPSELYKELYGDWRIAVGYAQTNAKSLRQECLWIKPEQERTIPLISYGKHSTRTLRQIASQRLVVAATDPSIGQMAKRAPKLKWTAALLAIFQKSPAGLSLSEIQQTIQIPRMSLHRYLKRWEAKGIIQRDTITQVYRLLDVSTSIVLDNSFGQAQRAKKNGISCGSQGRLDKIARLAPELLKQIAERKLSVRAALRLCDPSKSVGGLSQLRRGWRLATEKEREIFRAEIDLQDGSYPQSA